MNLKEQKEKVLQMLKEDKITQAEALDLLELISAQKEGYVEEEENTSERKEKILLSFPEMPENFWDNDLQKFEVFADTDFKIIKKLALVGKNGEIDIKTHNKPSIEIEGTFQSVRNNELKVDFEERNGNYRLNYDYNSVRFMSLSVKIPEDKLNELHLETSNAMISLTNIKANKAKLNTRNGEIKLKNLDIDSLEATTRNSKIMLREVRAEKVELTTKNAQINISGLVSDYAEMTTKNDSVSINDSRIKSAAIQTKNANVWYDLSTNKIIDNYLIEAGTANADIVVILPEVDSLAYKLKASTKRGIIIPVGNQFVESASNNGNLIGKTENYDHREGKIDMVLETRNANIVLKSED